MTSFMEFMFGACKMSNGLKKRNSFHKLRKIDLCKNRQEVIDRIVIIPINYLKHGKNPKIQSFSMAWHDIIAIPCCTCMSLHQADPVLVCTVVLEIMLPINQNMIVSRGLELILSMFRRNKRIHNSTE